MNASVDNVIETTVQALGLELVDLESGQHGKVLRVFIDRAGSLPTDPLSGITVADCERVTRQLQRVLPVEGIAYDRLEVSSPGLDRVLKTPSDFAKFAGFDADVRLRVPQAARRKFSGVLRGFVAGAVQLEVEGVVHAFALGDVERARLAPRFEVPAAAARRKENARP